MAEKAYVVVSITLDNYDDVEDRLEDAINSRSGDGLELVSCFPAVAHFGGELHQVPLSVEGDKPYDEVWTAPMGPSFVAVFRRSRG